MDGQFEGGIGFRTEARLLKTDGKANFSDQELTITDAREIIFAFNIGTSAKGYAPAEECLRYPSPEISWEELLKTHTATLAKYTRGYNSTYLV